MDRSTGGRRVAVAAFLLLAGCAEGGAELWTGSARLHQTGAAATAAPVGAGAGHGLPALALADPAPVPAAAAPAPEPAAAPAPPPGWGVGETGEGVLQLERRLAALGYVVGAVDGRYDEETGHAVMAFQKVHGLERSGRATPEVVSAVAAATGRPAPLVPGGGFRRVEVDLDRQILFLYEGNALTAVVNVSTGSNERFCSEGWCRRAVTPVGAFTVYEQRWGWETAPLGRLYNSQYFNGGIAIHGSYSVPAYPASHGCVRVPMSVAEWLPERLDVGTPVYVVAASEPRPTPVGLPAPDPARPAPVPTPGPPVPEPSSPSRPATPPTTRGLLESLLGGRR